LLVSSHAASFCRQLCKCFALALFALASSCLFSAEDSRSLSFVHTHTGKSLQVTYWSNGEYQQDSLQKLKLFLADWRDGEQIDIDPGLFDLLYRIRQATGSTGRFEVISAYRSPKTNEMLRQRSNGGVARKSQHLLGKAIDVRLSDVDTQLLYETALALQSGGVGYYAKSDFVHVDTGRVRTW
jgi:uncharacterized protein YcbK (DUF882 family)